MRSDSERNGSAIHLVLSNFVHPGIVRMDNEMPPTRLERKLESWPQNMLRLNESLFRNHYHPYGTSQETVILEAEIAFPDQRDGEMRGFEVEIWPATASGLHSRVSPD
jgi:hypothetical protein